MQRLLNTLNLLSVSFPTQLLCDTRHNVIACTNGPVFLSYDMHVYMYFISFATYCINYIALTPFFIYSLCQMLKMDEHEKRKLVILTWQQDNYAAMFV